MDSFDVILAVVLFMCLVAALPSPEEIVGLKPWIVPYVVFYRFLQQICINARALPGVGGIVQQVEQTRTTTTSDGAITQVHKTETTALTPSVSTEPKGPIT